MPHGFIFKPPKYRILFLLWLQLPPASICFSPFVFKQIYLYKVHKQTSKGEKFEYVWNEEGLEDAKKKIGPGYRIQRYNGLGEMNADQLWETTMNPKTRTLIQVSIDNEIDAERQVSILMGSDSGARKDWINENVKFTLEDDFFGENKGGE